MWRLLRRGYFMQTALCISGLTLLSIMLASCRAESSEDALGELLAQARAALDRWGKGDIEGPLSCYAPEITYFDPSQEKRVDGIDALRKVYEPVAGKLEIARYEITGAKVQRYGDVAILTLNLTNDVVKQPGGPGNVRYAWNCTQVNVRQGGKWRVVHEHWSFIKPEPKTVALQ
jgi:uncharacterized protein (TIGR02246 family)